MRDIKKINKNIIYVAAFFLIAAVSFVYRIITNNKGEVLELSQVSEVNYEASDSSITVNETTIDEYSESEISIYLCGAVNSPGVYVVREGSILKDVIDVAGGLSEDAAADYINLVYVLQENISIYLPTTEDINELSLSNPNNFNIIRYDANVFVWGDENEEMNIPSELESASEDTSGLININSASLSELMTLPGIGEVKAQAIIDYRNNTPFNSIEEIMNVAGIGESRFNAIRSLICV